MGMHAEVVLKLAVPQPSKRPDVFEWIQGRLVGIRKEHYPSAADFYYASARLPEYDKANDRRWDSIFPRTTMFKRLFRHIKVNSSAVQMVESLWATGFSPYVLETLPEAIMIPLRDAISLCQPHPPTAWTKELLDLVNRGDVRSLLSPDQKALPLSRNILVSKHVRPTLDSLLKSAIGAYTCRNVGLQALVPECGVDEQHGL